MKVKVPLIVLVLVVLNIPDGSFQNPSALDWVKLLLLLIVLVLCFLTARKNAS
jgi:hypothetical protein